MSKMSKMKSGLYKKVFIKGIYYKIGKFWMLFFMIKISKMK